MGLRGREDLLSPKKDPRHKNTVTPPRVAFCKAMVSHRREGSPVRKWVLCPHFLPFRASPPWQGLPGTEHSRADWGVDLGSV